MSRAVVTALTRSLRQAVVRAGCCLTSLPICLANLRDISKALRPTFLPSFKHNTLPKMLSSSLFWLLLAVFPCSSLGFLSPFLPAYRGNNSVIDVSPSAGISLAFSFGANFFWDLPLTLLLFQPSRNHSSHPAHLASHPSYAAYGSDGSANLIIQLHGNVRRQANFSASASRVDRLVNNLLIGVSIVPEDGKDFPSLNTTGYDDIARWRVRNDVLVEPVSKRTFAASFPGFCAGRKPVKLTTDLNGDFRAYIFFDLSGCVSDTSSDLTLLPSVGPSSTDLSVALAAVPDVAPADLQCPATVHELQTVFTDKHGDIGTLVSSPVLLVPPRGLTISSDIDDVLRVAEVWNWKQAMLWLVARPYQPWGSMPEILQSWKDGGLTHFHYTSDTISMNANYYIEGTERFYPRGSWDFRPFTLEPIEMLNSSVKPFLPKYTVHQSKPIDEVKNPRYHNLKRLLEQFPLRKFVLIGDTSTSSTCDAYPRLALEYPDQVACVLMRDTRATEPADWMSSDTFRFRSLPPEKYFFFKTPDDLKQITIDHLRNVVAGNHHGCYPPGARIPPQSYRPSATLGNSFSSIFLGLWYRNKCHAILWQGKDCPFNHTHFRLDDYTKEEVDFWVGDDTADDTQF